MIFDQEKARQFCEGMSLARNVPRLLRDQARHELYAIALQANELFPSFTDKRLNFTPPPGWRSMNHSITWCGSRLLDAVRASHYIIDDRGPRIMDQSPNFSRTFLLNIDPHTLNDTLVHEIVLPEPLVERVPGVPAGFEDMRIFSRGDELHGIFVRCDQNDEGWPEQWTGTIVKDKIINPHRMRSPEQRRPEKNWMPAIVDGREIWYVYSCDPVLLLDEAGRPQIRNQPTIAADHFRGSSQVYPISGGALGSLALVHTCTIDKLWPKNLFRFVTFDSGKLAGVSDAFRFPDRSTEEYLRGYQYVMGLAPDIDGKRFIISYSLGDGQSRLGVVDANEVWRSIREI